MPEEPHSWFSDNAVLKMFHNCEASSVNGKARRLAAASYNWLASSSAVASGNRNPVPS